MENWGNVCGLCLFVPNRHSKRTNAKLYIKINPNNCELVLKDIMIVGNSNCLLLITETFEYTVKSVINSICHDIL